MTREKITVRYTDIFTTMEEITNEIKSNERHILYLVEKKKALEDAKTQAEELGWE